MPPFQIKGVKLHFREESSESIGRVEKLHYGRVEKVESNDPTEKSQMTL